MTAWMQDSCPVCLGEPNNDNFGGCCDGCEAKRRERTTAAREQYRRLGLEHTATGGAIGAHRPA